MSDQPSHDPPPVKGKAFLQGGVGCVAAFLLLAVFTLAIGGSVYLDLGGVVMLLVIGGVIGLIVNSIYQRGRRDAAPPPPERQEPDR